MENNNANQNESIISISATPFSTIFKAFGSSLIFRGVIMLLFGVLFWVRPIQVMNIILVVIGIMLMVDSIPLFISALKISGPGKVAMLIPAIFLLGLGLLCTFNTMGIANIGIIIIGIWQLISGFQSLSTAKNSGALGVISSLLTILVGVIFIAAPMTGLLSLSWLLALCIIISGISALTLGIKLRSAVN